MLNKNHWFINMGFPERIVKLRKRNNLTQQRLAELVGVKVLQIRRYESGASQPTLEVIKQLAIALNVSSDHIIFGRSERDPNNEFKLQFEALQSFNEDEKRVAKELLESLILKHNAKNMIDRINDSNN